MVSPDTRHILRNSVKKSGKSMSRGSCWPFSPHFLTMKTTFPLLFCTMEFCLPDSAWRISISLLHDPRFSLPKSSPIFSACLLPSVEKYLIFHRSAPTILTQSFRERLWIRCFMTSIWGSCTGNRRIVISCCVFVFQMNGNLTEMNGSRYCSD